MFSNAGPYFSSPDETNKPKEIPNKYKFASKIISVKPRLKIENSKTGDMIRTAGTIPINARTRAVIVNATIISLILIGETNRFVKFLLQISSKKSILKLMLDLNKKS